MSVQATGVTLDQVEIDTLAGLDVVVTQLDHVLPAFGGSDRRPAEDVAISAERLTASRLALHRHIVALIAGPGMAVPELRLVAALLNVIPCVARMGEQCVVLAKVAQHCLARADDDHSFAALDRMGAVTRSQVVRAKRVFAGRDEQRADELLRHDTDLRRLGRLVFESAIARHGPHRSATVGAMAMVAARCLEHIGDDAVEIGEQGYLIVADAFVELADAGV